MTLGEPTICFLYSKDITSVIFNLRCVKINIVIVFFLLHTIKVKKKSNFSCMLTYSTAAA